VGSAENNLNERGVAEMLVVGSGLERHEATLLLMSSSTLPR
jgi:hypothetical protein